MEPEIQLELDFPEEVAKQYLTYDEVHQRTHLMHFQMMFGEFEPDYIVGVARGGLLPALVISHLCKRPLITINWQTRDGSVKEINPKLMGLIYSGKRVLFIDDINDSGLTFQQIHDQYVVDKSDSNHVKFAAVVERPTSTFRADYVGMQYLDKAWICFPWEE